MKINYYNFERVYECSFPRVPDEIYYRIKATNVCCFRLQTHTTRLCLDKTLITPVLTYESECWTLLKAHQSDLLRFASRILMKVFDAICETMYGKDKQMQNILTYTEIYMLPGILKWTELVMQQDITKTLGGPDIDQNNDRQVIDEVGGILHVFHSEKMKSSRTKQERLLLEVLTLHGSEEEESQQYTF